MSTLVFMAEAEGRAKAVSAHAARTLGLTADQQHRLKMMLWGAFSEATSAALAQPSPEARWACADCGHVGTEDDANRDFDHCGHCNESFSSFELLCPGCGDDSLCSACPKCRGSWAEDLIDRERLPASPRQPTPKTDEAALTRQTVQLLEEVEKLCTALRKVRAAIYDPVNARSIRDTVRMPGTFGGTMVDHITAVLDDDWDDNDAVYLAASGASAVVEALFADLRDRRFLKWLFDANPDRAGPILHERDGTPLYALSAEAQADIRAAWIKIVEGTRPAASGDGGGEDQGPCAGCGQRKPLPLRRDEMNGYVCLTCVDKALDRFVAEDEARADALASMTAERDRSVEALEKAKEATVLTLAFVGRDRGTPRFDTTLDQLMAKFTALDPVIRAALASSQADAGERG